METTFLILEDGNLYQGKALGMPAPLLEELDLNAPMGEVVFNTSMTGYQEILTDPSYHGQMVVMTYPHIGNYGCERAFEESLLSAKRVCSTSMIVHSAYEGPLPPKRVSLDVLMKETGVVGINGVDTRALTLHVRKSGSKNGLLFRKEGTILTAADKEKALAVVSAFPKISERDLIEGIAVKKAIVDPSLPVPTPEKPQLRFALVDFGIKSSIICELYKRNIAVTLLPPTATKEDVLASGCDALFLSNGPGDPERLQDAVAMVKGVMESMPVFGICLGHQLITWAVGGKTEKMKFGHHGGNHPVIDLQTGACFVTSQNHGFTSSTTSLPPDVQPWFINANDQTIEGLMHSQKAICSVQFHPEASPGPHDGRWIFDRFIEKAKEAKV